MPALLLGSISTLADTSELQRKAFNEAFREHGLDWEWSQEEYRDQLTSSGGANRVAAYAEQRGEQVDANRVHAMKTQIFQQSFEGAGLAARPGVVETIAAAKEAGWHVCLVTTTSRGNVDALLHALPDVSADDFDVITDVTTVEDPKPSPAAFLHALSVLGDEAADSVAVEDNLGGVESAQAAGLTCLAFPNENTAGHDFGSAQVVDKLSFDEVQAAAGADR